MTTPPTPADWYPDPENPAGLRYWDGGSWTEHRAPGPVAAEDPASAPATSVSPLTELAADERPTTVVPTQPAADSSADAEPDALEGGSHRVPDDAQPLPVQPYDTHPPASFEPASYEPASFEPPSYEPSADESTPWNPPLPSWETPPAEQTYAPPPTQRFEAAPFAPPPGPPPEAPPPLPPTGRTEPSGDGPNKKLVAGILGGAAAVLLVLAVIITWVLIRQDEPTVTSSPTTSSSTSETTSTESTSETSSESSATGVPAPPPAGAEGSDGDYKFSVASTETGDTITSTVSDAVETTADGIYYVVHLNVANTGPAPLTFVATFQGLNAAGQVFPLDDQATAFLGGTVASIDPGAQVETALVYDVPVGTEPDSILLRADPSTPGVELPLR